VEQEKSAELTALLARIAERKRWAARLVILVAQHYPRTIASTTKADDWSIVGPAFVARCTCILEAIVELPDRHASEAEALVRVLYEYVTIFCWLAIDPVTNIAAWTRRNAAEAIKADNDVQRYNLQLLQPNQRAQYEAIRDAGSPMPPVADCAQKADEYWARHTVHFSSNDKYSLRGMYPAIYRQHSMFVHAAADPIYRLVLPGPTAGMNCIGRETLPSEANAFTSAPLLFSMCLIVASHSLGFPNKVEVIHSLRADDGTVVSA
jgi:hypothetical protein